MTDYADLEKRLLEHVGDRDVAAPWGLLEEAADALAALSRERDEAREALAPFARWGKFYTKGAHFSRDTIRRCAALYERLSREAQPEDKQ